MAGKRYGKRQIETIIATMEADKAVKVVRPSLVDFILGGGFWKMAIASPAALNNDARRMAECEGWIVPDDSLGYTDDDGKPRAKNPHESIRLWCEKHLTDLSGVKIRDHISLVMESDGTCRLYRRA